MAKQYNTDQQAFQQQARLWTQTYARKPGREDQAVGVLRLTGVQLPAVCVQVADLVCLCPATQVWMLKLVNCDCR